ncbi:hypothetical protein N0V87_000267 [Didymella glomerata]|jgi:hypothetical protein|uniref:Uncharacterized protein n=1 Tax=Didymella glomerata TaxID=749621 RepID=A0A9W9C4S2_9PLEO|nr:hypothetical protein N0V87_000267 [Didymella glomerata]
MSLNSREPTPFTAEVATTIECREEDTASPFLPIPRSAFVTPDAIANDIVPMLSLYPDRLLAKASSSVSPTERPAGHGRVNPTTVALGEMTKWMETGTFGSQTPEDLDPGVEVHIVCMLQEDVEAGLAATENSTESKIEEASGDEITKIEVSKKMKKHRKSDSLH